MAEFPKIGETYTSLDNEYRETDRMEGIGKMLRFFLIVGLVGLCIIQVYQIHDLQKRVRHLEYKNTLEVKPEFSSLENANAKQDSKIRQLSTDIDLLYKILEGKDPYHTEEE